MFHLWNGLAQYVANHSIDVLFGVASFHGTDVAAIADQLSYLHHNHLAPTDIRVRVRDDFYQSMDLVPSDKVDRKSAMIGMPALIKAYLRLGGLVGDGAFVDTRFNTIDACLIMDTEQMNQRYRAYYTRDKSG